MNDEVKEILGRLDEAVKALENVENDTPTDIFEDIGVLASDVAQVLYAEDAETKAKEKKEHKEKRKSSEAPYNARCQGP